MNIERGIDNHLKPCAHAAADTLRIALRGVKASARLLDLQDAIKAAECMDDFASHIHARPILSENVIEFGALARGFLRHYDRRVKKKPTLDLCDDIYVELDSARALCIGNHSDREVSLYCYPEVYKGPKPIESQIRQIAEIFNLDPESALEYSKKFELSSSDSRGLVLPIGAEGWFAVPSAEALGQKYFPNISDPDERYCRALNLAHGMINSSRNFHCYLAGQIDKAHLRVLPRTRRAFETVNDFQRGDIFIIPVQLGAGHGGKSPSLARDTFRRNEYGLDSLSVSSILLTHPERLTGWNELGIECPGNVFDYYRSGLFTHTPNYSFRGTGVRAYHIWNWDGYSNYGPASFFLPDKYFK